MNAVEIEETIFELAPQPFVSDEVAIFEGHLEAFLSANWTELLVARKNAQTAAVIGFAENQLVYRTATLEADGRC